MRRTWTVVVVVGLFGAAFISAGRADDAAGTAPETAVGACLVGGWDGYAGSYADVWADGNYVYLPNFGLFDGNPARVHVVDISDPTRPVLDETLLIPPPNDGASPQDVKVGDGLLFVALEGDPNDSVAIYDVRDPAARALVAIVHLPDSPFVHNLFYDEGFLYLPSSLGIAVVDLTQFDPDNPPSEPITEAKWIFGDEDMDFLHDLTARNGRLYVAAWNNGLLIYDVNDVANTMPTLLGSVGGVSTHSVWPTDDGRFVVTGEERFEGGIKVYRMTEEVGGALTLSLTDSLILPGAFSVHNQLIVGNRLYNSWYERGLQVFDINPETGVLEFVADFDTYTNGFGNWGVYPFLGEDRVLLSDVENGLFVVSIGEACQCLPSAPAKLTGVKNSAGKPVDLVTNRVISLSANEPGRSRAIRVIFDSLPPPWDVWDGTAMWLTEPEAVCDLSGVVNAAALGCGTALQFSRLTCDPAEAFYADWSTYGAVHVVHAGIVPGGVYDVQVIDVTCDPADEFEYSSSLMVHNSKFGDVGGGFDPDGPAWAAPDGVVDIFPDALAAIAAFSNTPGNPTKTRADLEPCILDFKVNISDIVQILQGFQNLSYPFAPGMGDCPSDPCASGDK